jgi:GAF domain
VSQENSDPSIGLESISHHARVLTRGTGAAIALAHKGSMICRASVGNAPTLGARLDVSTGLSGECVRTGKTMRCDNSEIDPRVDAANCRRLGIQSILAAPIRLGGEVVGILEVFSSQRFNFHDGDLAIVEDLAKAVFVVPPSAKATSASALPTNVPPPKLLLELEPRWQAFIGNLTDLLFPPQIPPLKLTSRPAPFWPDVLVPSEPAWEGFYQSLLVHVSLVAMLGLIEFGLSQRPLLRQSRLTVNKTDTVYYLPPEYLRALRGESEPTPKSERSLAKPRVISVRRDSARHTQKSIAPPPLHLKDSRFRITAYNPVTPAVPFSATKQSPKSTRATSEAAIAPPPDTSAMSRAQRMTLGTSQAVAPAPSVDPSASQRAGISLGHQNVVGPAPEISGGGQRSLSGSPQATLDRAGTLVVPPAPSLDGSTRQTAGISLGHQNVVGPAPQIPGDAQRSLSGSAQATLARGATSVVPPPPSVGGSTHQTAGISLGHLQVVRPAPEISLGAQHSLASSASLARGATTVVPPPPVLEIAGSYLIDTPDGGAILVVPPPPSVGGLERHGSHSAGSLAGGRTQGVVPPPPGLQGAGTAGRGTGNGMAVGVVPPAPSVGGLGGSGGHSATSLVGGGTQAVVPPPPGLQTAGTAGRGTGNGMAMGVVPPAPSIGGLGGSGGHSASSLRGGGTQAVVPPPPGLQGAGTAGRGTGNGMAMGVVPPPPSVRGVGGSGHSAGSLGGGATQAVVPPPPGLQAAGTAGRGTGNGMAMGVVPPPPSARGLGGAGGGSSSQRAASMQMAQPKIGVQAASEGTQEARASGLPGGSLPGEIGSNGGEPHAESKKAIAANELGATKVLSISFIGPALAFPQSSYFSNFEVFIAEERLSHHQSRIIKLVYDFLPYQPKLSDLGPDYPALDNLHSTRDPSCDETLKEVESLASTLHWPQASLAQLNTASSKQRQLPCYRTTADDYRKAMERHR